MVPESIDPDLDKVQRGKRKQEPKSNACERRTQKKETSLDSFILCNSTKMIQWFTIYTTIIKYEVY